jgi:ABC-2 type transport system permease protein
VAEPRVERFLIYERLWASGLPTVAAIASVQARAFLVSPLLYVTSAVSLLLTAVLVYLPDLAGGRPVVMGDILSLMELVMTFAVPLYTMGLLADERRIGTLEVLLTSAVRSWELVAGRWMAGLAAFVVTVVPSLAYVVLVSVQQPLRDDYGLFGHHVRLALVDYGAIATGYVGVILLGAAWVAVGLLASSLVSRRAVAAIVAMAALLALYVAGDHLSLPAPLAALAESLNARSHAQPFLDGRLTPGDLVYFASLAVAALMLATGVLGMRRWRP